MEKQEDKLFPRVDSLSTMHLIETFGEQFYNAKPAEREKLLEHISLNLSFHGKLHTVEEIKTKFVNLRRSYNKYRKDLNNGIPNKWKYYRTLDTLLKNKLQTRKRTVKLGSRNVKLEPEVVLTEYEPEETPR